MSTAMATAGALNDLVEPVVAAHDLSLFDLEMVGGVLRVTVDRPGGVGVDEVAAVSRALSRALDEDDPISSRYTLEVSSPGLERALRTPEHFAWAVGQQVSIKVLPTAEGDRRVAGTLVTADDQGIVVDVDGEQHRIPYDQVDRARTVFEWGPAPKPSSPQPARGTKQAGTPEAGTDKRVEAS